MWQPRSISIKFSLVTFSIVMVVLLTAASVAGVVSMRQAVVTMTKIVNDDIAAQAMVNEIRLHMETSRSQVLQALQHNPASDYARMHDHTLAVHFDAIRKQQADVARLWAVYRQAIQDPRETAFAEAWSPQSVELGTASLGAASVAIESGQWDEAQKILIRMLNPAYSRADQSAEALSEMLRQRSALDIARVHSDMGATHNSIIASVGVVIAIGLCAAWYIVGAIRAPWRGGP